jgi:predicted deacetylase
MSRDRALICLNDVTPAFETEIRQALDLIRQWRLPGPALCVVPDYHGRWPLDAHPAFSDFVKDLHGGGCEILLHGYDHRAPGGVRPDGVVERVKARLLTSGEAEFQTLPFGRTMERLGRGLGMLERSVGVRPEGFVAPGWLEHPDTYRALDASGFAFHEDFLGVEDLRSLERRPAPVISFTSHNLLRTYASLAWARALMRVVRRPGDLRLALHPGDFASGMLGAAIGDLARAIGEERDWVSYGEFLDG